MVGENEIARWQIKAIDAVDKDADTAIPLETKYPAPFAAKIGNQERSVGIKRNAIGPQFTPVGCNSPIEPLFAIGQNVGNASSPVGREEITVSRAQDTLGTIEPSANERQGTKPDFGQRIVNSICGNLRHARQFKSEY